MMYPHRHGGYEASYYEAEHEVVRAPRDSYSSEYRVQEYVDPGYPMGHHHHHNGVYEDRVTEVVSYESNPGYVGHDHHRHHHGGIVGAVEKAAEVIYEKTHDPYGRRY